jgi:hypothetical protein
MLGQLKARNAHRTDLAYCHADGLREHRPWINYPPLLDLGIAHVFPEGDGNLRFEGRDVSGKRWHVWLPAAGGIGGTDVWIADFDHNSRRDLLISSMFPKNGRCIDRTTIYFLMFDQKGRPVPWAMPSNTFAGYGHQPPFPTCLDCAREHFIASPHFLSSRKTS